VGILLGLSLSGVVGRAVTALTGLLAALLGLVSEKLTATENSEVSLIGLIVFSIACTVGDYPALWSINSAVEEST
jgi:hypothetical protein